MKVSRRQFIITMIIGALGLAFGRFFNLFKTSPGKVARHWRRGDNLAG